MANIREDRLREVETAVYAAGKGGLTVGQVAKAIKRCKSYTFDLLKECVRREWIVRDIREYGGDRFVFYCSTQMLLPTMEEYFKSDKYSPGGYSAWDGLNAECKMCGKEFSGSSDGYCASCRAVWNG